MFACILLRSERTLKETIQSITRPVNHETGQPRDRHGPANGRPGRHVQRCRPRGDPVHDTRMNGAHAMRGMTPGESASVTPSASIIRHESADLVSAIAVEKRYASVKAVDAVTFSVRAGEVFALLGPNGAGKSTVIRMLLGLIHPDAGEITYHLDLDGEPGRRPGASEIGYLPEERGLYQDVEVLRTLVHFGVLRGMSRHEARATAERWLDRLDLGDRAREPLKALSKGNQQKVQFLSAVLHAPRFALLDEPFSGLDPLNQELMLTLIDEMRASGTTVLLSAHQMQLVERIADRVMVMNAGRAILNGTMAELRSRWSTGKRMVLRVAGVPNLDFMERHHPHVTARVIQTGEIELFVADGNPLGPLLADAGSYLDIREIETHPVTLHDVYVGTVGAGNVAPEAQQ